MADTINNESMLGMYIFETNQLIEQLEQLIILGEETNGFSKSINEIFRIMHTIKGSSSMMLYNNIAELSHTIEDLFYYLREKKPRNIDYNMLSDIMLRAVDFIKNELNTAEKGMKLNGNPAEINNIIKNFLTSIQSVESEHEIHGTKGNKDYSERQKYKAILFFEEGCELENIRAFTIVHKLKEIADEVCCTPENVMEDDIKIIEQIRKDGFKVYFKTSLDSSTIRELFEETIFVSKVELTIEDSKEDIKEIQHDDTKIILSESDSVTHGLEVKQVSGDKNANHLLHNQGMMSVNIEKTDRLMNLIGELVISEAMVTQNPDLNGLKLDNFYKAARQLHKITSELQDAVMSIRMTSLSATFYKMHRIVRDMSKKMNKDVRLEIIGEETEVDKNIIDHIADPLMHLVRNAVDHGIESMTDRKVKGKLETGRLILEAKHAGSDVLITIKDDGKGLNKERLLEKAKENGLLDKQGHEMSEKEIFNLIFLPGFSTSHKVTEFSGRGVGMDVVTKNIETIGGGVSVDSIEGNGTTVTLKIPLTLAIIDGMNVSVGRSRYTIPMASIKESFRPNKSDIICDPDNNEMIMLRGECYPILRLHEHYKVKTDITQLYKGILIMAEHNERSLCIFADQLLGQQQVVVKALPGYIKSLGKTGGLGGCTLLGDGNISLILDIEGLINK
jgi:two-component system chemotaxis sensor kinase CheA